MINIAAANAILHYYPQFIAGPAALSLFYQLQQQLAWQQDQVKIYGKMVIIPRLQAWYGDNELTYQYAGLTLTALAWPDELKPIKTAITTQCQTHFNAVLANYYRDEQDTVGWHSDDEAELGRQPVIASLSLGGERNFVLKHKLTGEKLTIPLKSGDLLVMAGDTQAFWQHSLPRSKIKKAPRINLTFRQIKN